jgi:hypothetical protein
MKQAAELPGLMMDKLVELFEEKTHHRRVIRTLRRPRNPH